MRCMARCMGPPSWAAVIMGVFCCGVWAQPMPNLHLRKLDARDCSELSRSSPTSSSPLIIRGTELQGPIYLNGIPSLNVADSVIAGLHVAGRVTGSIIIERVSFNGACTLRSVEIGGDLVFRDCVFAAGYTVQDSSVGGSVVFDSCTSKNFRSEVRKVRAKSIEMVACTNPDSKASDGHANILDYRAFLLDDIEVVEDVVVRDTVTSLLHVSGRVGRDLSILGSAARRLRLDQVVVRERSTLWPESPIVWLEIISCDLGDSVRLRLPSHSASIRNVSFAGGLGGFRELPRAELLIPLLDGTGGQEDQLDVLTGLERSYEEIGNSKDARFVEDLVADLRLRNATRWEFMEQFLRRIGTGPGRGARLLGIWLITGITGFTVLFTGQYLRCFRILASDDLQSAAPMGRPSTMLLVSKVVLDGLMPVPVEHGVILTGLPFFIHAFMRLIVWVLLLLFVQSLA